MTSAEAPGRRSDLKCGDCSSPMVLRDSRRGLFYGCSKYPSCTGTHGAHPDGSPLGTPGDFNTKSWRRVTHSLFDRMWDTEEAGNPKKRKGRAYGWLKGVMGYEDKEAHIGDFSAAQCEKVIRNLILREKRQIARLMKANGTTLITMDELEKFLRG